ncbi:hypothetical protein AVEN_194865-1 [Araneus ventricosus]|uniref:Uncharacterized protein n=1 Tax=Araneus ventricosus TaxID=182803 RepID=A0A4Y2B354_ARAVE|nr:hypothetical protein AVEN_194865-1 [Araneus ventricosus]
MTTQTTLSNWVGHQFNFTEIYSSRLSDYGPFIKRRGRKKKFMYSKTASEIKSKLIISSAVIKEKRTSASSEVGHQEFISACQALIRTMTKKLLIWGATLSN